MRYKINNKKKSETYVAPIHSLGLRVSFLISLIVIISCGCLLLISSSISKKVMKDVYSDYMMSLARSTASSLSHTNSGGISIGNSPMSDTLSGILGGVKIMNVESSYAYLVGSDGTMLYHPTASKIGQQVENEKVRELVNKIKNNEPLKDTKITYTYNGKVKYASCSFTLDKRIVVVTADESEMLTPIKTAVGRLLKVMLAIILFWMIVGFIVTKIVCAPIQQVTSIVSTIGKLDFRKNNRTDKLIKHKDETGVMTKVVCNMSENIKGMLLEIENVKVKISESMNKLQHMTESTAEVCSDNSATTEQLSAGMEETSATTTTINEHIGLVRDEAEKIGSTAQQGADFSHEVMIRASDLKDKTESASASTRDVYDDVKSKAANAIENVKKVQKITELTATITDIASQTNLLALNASIEAAHAGDSGRGFSVVADEIGKLSVQTADAVKSISEVVDDVTQSVLGIEECLEVTLDFIDTRILPEYEEFANISEQYQTDADSFKDSMDAVLSNITVLINSIQDIAEALNGINATIEESTIGVSDVANKTGDVAEQTAEIRKMADECFTCVGDLSTITEKFLLD